MLSKLNDDNLYHILLYNKSIIRLNNHLHISKHIYNLIINNYNILYANYTHILYIRRWNIFSKQSTLLKNIKNKLYESNNILIDLYESMNINSLEEFNISIHYYDGRLQQEAFEDLFSSNLTGGEIIYWNNIELRFLYDTYGISFQF